ncbi:MAG: glycosyltransferase family 87 protein [Flavobacteriales bacterium]
MNARNAPAPTAWWVVWAAASVIVRLLSAGILEGGDGVQHYQIAHYAWRHPELFLHHWGKPLFTLCASPFAQLGHWGMTLFNALCFVVTCWAADGLLRRAGRMARWFFAPALLLVPVYGTMVLAGMTEVFFAMLVMLVVRALFEERYVLAMIIVSFMPFARPEYIAFAPFVIGWVVWKRQWRALPFAAVGHVVYGVIGAIALGDALWAFHNDPYSGAQDIYGHGPFLYFVDRLQNIYGAPLVWAFGIALVAAGVLWVKQRDVRSVLVRLLVVAVLPSLAVLLVHSILWWNGWKGSLGLARVMATTAPLVVLCTMWPLLRLAPVLLVTRVGRLLASVIGGGLYFHWAITSFMAQQPLPVVPNDYDHFVRSVGEYVGKVKDQYSRVTFYHPEIGYYAELDPYDTLKVRPAFGHETKYPGLGLGPSDLLVWDAHFGPNERGVPLDRVLTDPELELVKMMVPNEQLTVLGGHPFEVYLFARRNGQRKEERETLVSSETRLALGSPHRFDTIPCSGGSASECFEGGEFPIEITLPRFDDPDLLYVDLVVKGTLEWNGDVGNNAELVFTEENSAGRSIYWSRSVTNGGFSIHYRLPGRDIGMRSTLYMWNRSGLGFRLSDFRVETTRVLRVR